MKRIGVAIAACLIGPATHAGAPGAANPGFEVLLPDGTPASWFLQHGIGTQRFTSDTGRHARGGRLRVSGGPAATGMITQKIDPAPYRGKLVRLRVTIRAVAPAQAGPFLTVLRPEPYELGFSEDDSSQPAPVGEWREATITGRVAQDATAIWIGVKAVGEADITIDDVRLEQPRGRDKPPSPQALAYLDQAIAILRTHHINSAKADWPRLIAEAHAEIAGAKTPSETYSAIRDLIGELGVKHTVFLPPPTQAQIEAAAKAGPSGVVAGTEMPTSSLLDGRVGAVRLPGLDTFSPGGDERAKTYPRLLRAALEQFDKAPLCGWIVDLRNDTGGNMWPMLAGLDPLLGSSPFGFFVSTGRAAQPWIRTPDGIAPMVMQAGQSAAPAFALTHAAAPLAVLIGPRTTSSGEMTALALIGRPGVRTFGGNSGGFLSGNSVEPLPDGAHIAVTEVLVRDRTGKDYSDTIHPDVATDPNGAEQAGKAWIERQCGK
ncbi:MAG: S41 family peptidase [Sphingomonas sp.]